MVRQFWTNLVEFDILTILCVLVALGFIGVVYDLSSFLRRKRFAEKYLSKFNEFMDCGPYNPHKTIHHQWLLHNLTRLKNDMEGHGVLDIHSLAVGDYPIQDADRVSDTLVNITRYSDEDGRKTTELRIPPRRRSGFKPLLPGNCVSPTDKELAKTRSILEMYVGGLATLISRRLWWGLVNPFFWPRRIMRLIILDAPFWILQSVGVISGNPENKIRYYGVVSKVIYAILVLSTLFGLVRILIDIFGWTGLTG